MSVGFIPLEWRDFLDIAIVAFLIYQLYRYVRGTVGVQIVLALAVIFFVDVAVRLIGLTTVQALFGTISEVFVIALIIVFHPEIRRLLFLIGRNPFISRLVPSSAREKVLHEVIPATTEMARKRTGSLIVIARSTSLRNHVDSGTTLDAEVGRRLLQTIFVPKSPLHDGAVVIEDNRIMLAGCVLPLSSSQELPAHYGLRHRAALGLVERTDAVVVITSEETGQIALAVDGGIKSNLSIEELRLELNSALIERQIEKPAETIES